MIGPIIGWTSDASGAVRRSPGSGASAALSVFLDRRAERILVNWRVHHGGGAVFLRGRGPTIFLKFF